MIGELESLLMPEEVDGAEAVVCCLLCHTFTPSYSFFESHSCDSQQNDDQCK